MQLELVLDEGVDDSVDAGVGGEAERALWCRSLPISRNTRLCH
jgi:hypothetical protein